MVAQLVAMDFLERHRTMVVTNQNGFAAKAVEPFDDVLWIGDAAAHEEQLRLGRSQRKGEFVIQAAVEVPDHLVFIDHEQCGTSTPDKTVLLSLEGCYEHRGVEVFGKVARCDAHIPTASTPFSEF